MAFLLRNIKDTYEFIFYELQDDRTKDMFPAGWVLMTILPFYLYFTKNLGPRLMQDRKPFQLRTVIFYYNIFQIIVCAYILYLALVGGWMNGYNYTCQPVDMTENPRTRSMINAAWWYTVVKLIDLLDTVFFVLRKKDRQISFLHLFHHFIMPIASFLCLKYFPNGHGTSIGVFNNIVHIVMYTYYLIAGMGSKYQKYLWWKKYVTILQIVQFVAIFIHSAVALFNKDCDYPKWILTLLCIHSIQFIYLFGSFYYVNYIKKPKTAVNGRNMDTQNGNSHPEKLKAK